MARVAIVNSNDVEPGAPPSLAGISFEGKIQTRPVVAKPDRPIKLWFHTLAPGARLSVQGAAVGHTLYVWEGSIAANGQPVDTSGVVFVEQGGAVTIEAGAKGATLAHFHCRDAEPGKHGRTGGHVHVVGPNGAYRIDTPERNADYIIWADADCPSCELWLHQTRFSVGGIDIRTHFHTEDELIVVREGTMTVGNRELVPGTALAIDANTVYGFGTGDKGCAFINFRATDPMVVFVQRGKPLNPPISERENFKTDFQLAKRVMAENGISERADA